MKIISLTYGRGFTFTPKNSYSSIRIYREVGVELDPEDDPEEARVTLTELVNAMVEEDFAEETGIRTTADKIAKD